MMMRVTRASVGIVQVRVVAAASAVRPRALCFMMLFSPSVESSSVLVLAIMLAGVLVRLARGQHCGCRQRRRRTRNTARSADSQHPGFLRCRVLAQQEALLDQIVQRCAHLAVVHGEARVARLDGGTRVAR